MADVGRSLALCLLVVGLTFAPVAIAPGGGFGPGVAAAEDDDEPVYHRNPDESVEAGDEPGLEAWLSEELTDRLAESTSALAAGEYDAARELVGEDYQQRHAQYVALSGDPDRDLELYDDAGEAQRQLIESAEGYEELRAEYERALEDGDEERARELARELDAQADEADEELADLRALYDELEAETGEDLSEADEIAEEAEQELERDRETIQEAQFEETELALELEGETVSFLEPLAGEGELRTANGSPVADEPITLEVGNGTTTAETDGDGAFELEYRPTNESLEADELPVAYVPANDSTYLGAETTVDVALEQVEPEITGLEAPDGAAYGDELPVAGELAVDDEPVDDAVLEVAADDEHLGELTVSNGSFDGSVTVPESVPDGERELRVSLPFEGQALAGTTASQPVTIAETETALSVEATHVDGREVFVEGSLATDDGEPIANETVQVRVGEAIEPITLDADGTFNGTVAASDDASGDVPVVVAYDGDGTNLAAAEAETTASLPGADGIAPSLPAWGWLLLGVLAVVTVAGGLRQVRGGTSEPDGSSGPEPGRSAPDGARAEPAVTAALVSRAAAAQANGRPEAAVRACYVAVRRTLSRRIDADGGLTHWEFYRRWRREGVDETLLFDLTESYERAAFDAASVTAEEAAGVLERTRRLLADELAEADDD